MTSQAGSQSEQDKPRIDWSDPNVPIGNAPRLPRWPLVLMVCVWVAWLGFLLTMLAGA
ncbi:MAG: hypothetical protein PVI86_15945 [Phycisphaerae bacterium]